MSDFFGNFGKRLSSAGNQLIKSFGVQDSQDDPLSSLRAFMAKQAADMEGNGSSLNTLNALVASTLMQESGNRKTKPSVNGAIGPGQILPGTFAQFAKPGEYIDNDDDNRAVSARALESYLKKFGDPERAAVAYFSGPGNVSAAGSPNPWKRDKADGNNKLTSSYVSDINARMARHNEAAAQPTAQARAQDSGLPSPLGMAPPEVKSYFSPDNSLQKFMSDMGPTELPATMSNQERMRATSAAFGRPADPYASGTALSGDPRYGSGTPEQILQRVGAKPVTPGALFDSRLADDPDQRPGMPGVIRDQAGLDAWPMREGVPGVVTGGQPTPDMMRPGMPRVADASGAPPPYWPSKANGYQLSAMDYPPGVGPDDPVAKLIAMMRGNGLDFMRAR